MSDLTQKQIERIKKNGLSSWEEKNALCDMALRSLVPSATAATENEALRVVLDLCMEAIPDCRAYGDLPGYIAELKTPRSATAAIREKLTLLQVGKCSCLTKTPELKYHDERCTYRLASELEAMLAAAPAPAQAEPVARTPADYAIEHGEYLATAAMDFLIAVNNYDTVFAEDSNATEPRKDAARESRSEHWTGLQSAIHEFRKRAERAKAAPAAPVDSQGNAVRVEVAAIAEGDYVLATKWSDGDPGDNWALGFYAGEKDGRHYVKDSDGQQLRGNGFRRAAKIRRDVGDWLLNVAARQLEVSPPGTVNLWTMLTPSAFDLDDDRDMKSRPEGA